MRSNAALLVFTGIGVICISVQSTLVGCSRDVGVVESVDVSMVGKDGWFLEHLLIRDLRHQSVVYNVSCSCWFDYGNDAIAGSARLRHLQAVAIV